jgi:SAM-dependent methyltransferase
MPDTTPWASTPKRRTVRRSTGSSSSGTSRRNRSTRWLPASVLHHVADPTVVLDQVVAALRPGGTVVVIEWARERVDESTARWCFARLPQPPPGEDGGWLARRRDEWAASGQPWGTYREGWARREGMHTGRDVLDALDRRFQRQSLAFGPYFFPDLAGTTAADEQAAIDAGTIQATCLRYVGRLR